jgi:hypothetical protein
MMPSQLNGVFIKEPQLIFGGGNRHADQKIGLTLYGPSGPPDMPPNIKNVKVGIIGPGETVSLADAWLEKLKSEVSSAKKPPLFPSFPGFNPTFDCELIISKQWKEIITNEEISSLFGISSYEARVKKAANLYADKLKNLAEREPRPDVAVCVFSPEIIKYCGTRKDFVPPFVDVDESEQSLEDFIPEAADLRRLLKIKAMEIGLPVQLAKHSTFTGKTSDLESVQDEATRAWNLSVALYYKAGGFPWRAADAEFGTCYMGVSFYKEQLQKNLRTRTSMVQIFTHTGEGLVLRGERFEWDKPPGKSPHLTKEKAFKLINDALKVYKRQMDQLPARVVLHKSSRYFPDELEGFKEACRDVPKFDFVAFGKREIRFLRKGNYPPLRGTVVKLAKGNYLIYTRGYVPLYKTYPGHHVPRPLEILEHHGDSDIQSVCREILALTKMNWNSADYSTREPITLQYSRKIGEILANLPEDMQPKPYYYFYM